MPLFEKVRVEVKPMTMVLELTEAQKETLRRYSVTKGLTEEKALVQLVEGLPTAPVPDEVPAPRIAGLNKGWVGYMASDFDDPLPDEFWLGDETNAPLYQK